jgi:hypothetical protein
MTDKHHKPAANLTADGRTLVVTIPFKLQQRGGRRLVVTPAGTEAWASPSPQIDNTLLRALARAHRWKRMLQRGDYATIRDIERAEGVTNSFVSRTIRLSLLAPKIIEEILDGRQCGALQLEDLIYGTSLTWSEQYAKIISKG